MAENTPINDLHMRSITGRVYSKSSSDPVVSILTFPVRDLALDYVRPDGGDWSRYPSHPVVNWAHGIPVGRGVVELKALEFDNKVTNVAVGHTQFFKTPADVEGIERTEYDSPTTRITIGQYSIADCLRAAEDAEQLVRQDIATGVSIEFSPNGPFGKAYWDLPEWSPLEKRHARHFESWNGYGYAHARRPVNSGCRTLLDDDQEIIEKCFKVAETGLIGGHKLSDIVMKSFKDDSLIIPTFGQLKQSRFVRGGYEITQPVVKSDDEDMVGVPHHKSMAAAEATEAVNRAYPNSFVNTHSETALISSGKSEAAARIKDWGTAARYAREASTAHEEAGQLHNFLYGVKTPLHEKAANLHESAAKHFVTKAEEHESRVLNQTPETSLNVVSGKRASYPIRKQERELMASHTRLYQRAEVDTSFSRVHHGPALRASRAAHEASSDLKFDEHPNNRGPFLSLGAYTSVGEHDYAGGIEDHTDAAIAHRGRANELMTEGNAAFAKQHHDVADLHLLAANKLKGATATQPIPKVEEPKVGAKPAEVVVPKVEPVLEAPKRFGSNLTSAETGMAGRAVGGLRKKLVGQTVQSNPTIGGLRNSLVGSTVAAGNPRPNPFLGERTSKPTIDRSAGNAYDISQYAHARTQASGNIDALEHSTNALEASNRKSLGGHYTAIQHHELAEKAHLAKGENDEAAAHRKAIELRHRAIKYHYGTEVLDPKAVDKQYRKVREESRSTKSQSATEEAYSLSRSAHALTGKSGNSAAKPHSSGAMSSAEDAMEAEGDDVSHSHLDAASQHGHAENVHSTAGEHDAALMHGMAKRAHKLAANSPSDDMGNDEYKADLDDTVWQIVEDNYLSVIASTFPTELELKAMDPKNIPSAGVRAVLNFAQFLMDGTDALLADSKRSDDINMRRLCKSVANKAQSWAAELATRAQEAKKQLDAADGDGTVSMTWSDENQPVSVEAKSMDRDEDGMMLIIKAIYDEWEVRRYKPSNLKPISTTTKAKVEQSIPKVESKSVEVKADPAPTTTVPPSAPAPVVKVEQADPKEWEEVQKRLTKVTTQATQYASALNGRR